MKIGSLVFATDQGLGILAKSFFGAGVVTDVLVIRHGRRPEHDEWYPGSKRIGNLRQQHRDLEEFCASMDVMLFFETPFVWELLPFCRRRKVKTALMPMHECMPDPLPELPDMFLCPSLLDLDWAKRQQAPGVFIPVPAPADVPWRKRERANVFVHNAGWGGLKGRNGTSEVLAALDYVTVPARIIIRMQREERGQHFPFRVRSGAAKVEASHKTVPREELFNVGDVFLFPEKFNGLSLPLQEAHAAGMAVVCGDRFPMNTWLPREPLIPVERLTKNRVAPRCAEFDEAVMDPRAIAAKIDEWYGRDISALSEAGQRWAEKNSWERLKPRYLEVLCG